MIQVRKSNERGQADHGWLKSQHSFSFADYFDRQHMGHSVLRVINEDRIAGGTGFPSHPHRDMEIISFVIKGALEHQDSMGNKTTIRPGEIQRMSAGTGVVHSEYNAVLDQQTHFLQIWILPDKAGHNPSYGQINYESLLENKSFALLASKDGREGSITLNQDADIYLGRFKDAGALNYQTKTGRSLWIQMIHGQVNIMGQTLTAGDGAAITQTDFFELQASAGTEFILFDMITIPVRYF